MINFRFPIRAAAVLFGLAILATACGTSAATIVASPAEEDSASNPVAANPPADAPVTEDPTAVASDTTEAEAPPEPAEPPPAVVDDRVIEVSLDGGTPLLLPTDTCIFKPDATGPAAAVINIASAPDSGAELIVFEGWPFDGSTENGTSFIGTFTDDEETLYVLEQGEAAVVGGMVEVTAAVHTNLFYAVGDEPVGTLTVRCQP